MKLIVADDAALLREGLVGLLERQGHQILARAESATELESAVDHALAQGQPPDVIITDVRMPPGMSTDGLDTAVTIRTKYPQLGILLLSQYAAPPYAAKLFNNGNHSPGIQAAHPGGMGYLLKERVARVADFLDSLHIVASGGIVIDPDVASKLVSTQHSTLDLLSLREREVLELMARGLSNTGIAEHLVLSAGAVSKHVANIFTKLQLPAGEDNRRVRAVLTYLTNQQK